jgi:ATP-binding protein involved in chromosome partitioning
MSNSCVTKEAIFKAVAPLRDPRYGKDLGQLEYLQDVCIQKGSVTLTIVFPAPGSGTEEMVLSQVRKVVGTLPGVKKVDVSSRIDISSSSSASISPLIPEVKNVIAVASGKGGVGKSTVAANLATALHAFGADVGLMDADVYGPSIPKLMGATQPPEVTKDHKIIPPVMRGIKLISMAYFLPKDDAVIWRGPMLHKMIQDFLGVTEWGSLDYLVIDLPPGTGDIQLSLCQTVPLTGAVVVSTPQDLALEVASKAIHMFRKLKTPVLGIVENMSHFTCPHCGQRDDIFGHGGARQASSRLGYPFLGEIPLSSVIRERSDKGEPISLDKSSESEYARAFQEIASNVAGEIAQANMKGTSNISIEIA